MCAPGLGLGRRVTWQRERQFGRATCAWGQRPGSTVLGPGGFAPQLPLFGPQRPCLLLSLRIGERISEKRPVEGMDGSVGSYHRVFLDNESSSAG